VRIGLRFSAALAAVLPAKLRQLLQRRVKCKPFPAFPPGTAFFDVEGVPVALIPGSDGGLSSRAFDRSEPRPFPIGSVDRNGTRISETEFRADVIRLEPPGLPFEEWRKHNPQEWAAIVKRNAEDPESRALAEDMVRSLNEGVLRESLEIKSMPKPPKASPEYLTEVFGHDPALLKSALECLARREADEAIERAAER